MTTPEFSRPIRIDTLGAGQRDEFIEADPGERVALAERFGLRAIERLSATADLSRSGDVVRATGSLSARVTQSCVASGAPVTAEIGDAFRIEFRPEQAGVGADEEVELGQGDLDVVFYRGAAVDLGEAVAESLSLALDPYPRAPEAEAALAQAGVIKEGEEPPRGPFAALKDLLGKPGPRA